MSFLGDLTKNKSGLVTADFTSYGPLNAAARQFSLILININIYVNDTEVGGDRVFRKCANKAQVALWWSLGITKDAESG